MQYEKSSLDLCAEIRFSSEVETPIVHKKLDHTRDLTTYMVCQF
jgi:hypothetical protein